MRARDGRAGPLRTLRGRRLRVFEYVARALSYAARSPAMKLWKPGSSRRGTNAEAASSAGAWIRSRQASMLAGGGKGLHALDAALLLV